MKKLVLILMVLGLLTGLGVMPAQASVGNTYFVRPGDTLIRIAAHHGVSVSQLARANGLCWNAWLYVGQRLTIPDRTGGSTHPSRAGTYVVRYGDTLTRIADRYSITVRQLASANGLHSYSWVYAGQRLTIPGSTRPPVSRPASGERWIDVTLTTQTLTAYEGGRPVYTAVVSTGLPHTPTPVGQFRIWVKLRYDDMQGPGYYLPDVPFVMYFHRGYGLHGTYWHHNFGTPMSHGCVNLSDADARWLFNWASVGTRVVVRS